MTYHNILHYVVAYNIIVGCIIVYDVIVSANPPTNIVDFRGFDSIIILILRGGISRPLGNFLESLSQAMLVGTMLVGRLGISLL